MIGYKKGNLWMEGVSLHSLARRVGTPAYVYSAGRIGDNFKRLDHAFSAHRRLICYALKANSNRSVCRLLARAGAGADVVSGGELERALAAGFRLDRIVFSGVGKTDAELEMALRRRILALHVESAEELARLSIAARRLRRKAPFAVRVNPGVDALTHSHITTGLPENKFGVEPREALALYARARRDPWLRPVGVQCHIGSQVTRVAPYRKALAVLLGVVDVLERLGAGLEYVDVGGGMGITYSNESPLDPERLAAVLAPGLKRHPRLRLLLEPGRFLVADAGLLLTRVLARKSTSRRRFLIVDAAMNDLARPALYGAYHEIVPVLRSAGRKVRVDVVGPICESSDVLGSGRDLPYLPPGELLAVLQAGAYGFSMSSQYNSRPRAAEVLVDGRSYRVVRGRESFLDLVRHEK